MNSAPSNAKQIFLTAIEEFTQDQWPEYLDEACGDNIELRKRVELWIPAIRNRELLPGCLNVLPATDDAGSENRYRTKPN
jgi:hypothetical protein